MSQLRETLFDYEKYLKHELQLSRGSTTQYVNIVKHVLLEADPADLMSPQMLAYIRNGLPPSYAKNFAPAWRTFVKYREGENVSLPFVPELRRIRFVHPLYRDLHGIFHKYVKGLPPGTTWASFLATETDPRILRYAQRCYEFFTGNAQPLAHQPIFAKSPDSLSAQPKWVLDAITGSGIRRTSGAIEQMHFDLTQQIADAGLPVALSIELYQCFMVKYDAIRRREQSVINELFEDWERMIQLSDMNSLRQSYRAFCGITAEDEELFSQVIFL